MNRLLLLFVVVPVTELILLVEIGQRVGTFTTLGLILGTGVVGASLARQQGSSTFARLRSELAEGRSPAGSIIDGVLILVAAALLVTPGILTDAVGFLVLVPACRQLVQRYLKGRFERAIRTRVVSVAAGADMPDDPASWQPMKNVTPRSPGEPDD
jgi:UPF0716 protein FxsA